MELHRSPLAMEVEEYAHVFFQRRKVTKLLGAILLKEVLNRLCPVGVERLNHGANSVSQYAVRHDRLVAVRNLTGLLRIQGWREHRKHNEGNSQARFQQPS